MKPAPTRCPAWSVSACVAVLLVASCFIDLHCQADQEVKESQAALLNDVLNGLLKTVDFFASNYQYINIDAVFCIRLCQGSLIGILEDCESNRLSCPQEVVQVIKDINDRLSDIDDKAVPYVEKQNRNHLAWFPEMITKPFIIRYIPDNISSSILEATIYNQYKGGHGDRCIMELVGTSDAGDTVPRCTINDDCLSFMTRGGSGSYYLTHQLLYTMVSETIDCASYLEQRILSTKGITLRDFQRRLCGRVYLEALAINQYGFVSSLLQDLFMEQITFCGMLGFQDFFEESWIARVLGWQSPMGCYINEGSLTVAYGRAEKRSEGGDAKAVSPQEARESTKRIWKRTEMLMHDGCLSHKTGVAISAIGVITRYLVRDLYTLD